MFKFIQSQVLLLAGIAAITTLAASSTSLRFPVFNGTYIIVLREFENYTGGPLPSTYNNSKATVENYFQQNSLHLLRKIFGDHLVRNYLHWYHPIVGKYSPLYIGFVAELNIVALTQIRNLPEVYFVEKEQTYNISVPEWHLDRIDQRYLPLDGVFSPPFWTEYMSMGRGVDIYILDSGIRYSHNEFEGRAVYGGFDFQPSSAPNGPGSDCLGHGTHVAALAGGSTVGIARKATLHSIRIFGCSGGTSTSTVLQAIAHVIAVKPPEETVIMSMSFGGFTSASTNILVNIAHWNGIVPVAAAGNNNFDACQISPASAAHAFTVGATGIGTFDRAASFTNYGPCVNIFAPGVDIRSASHLSDDGYTVYSGTSMAAPLVSGAAAVILDRCPYSTPDEVMCKLISHSTKKVVYFASIPWVSATQTQNRLLYVDPE